jgi:hypothetical protein
LGIGVKIKREYRKDEKTMVNMKSCPAVSAWIQDASRPKDTSTLRQYCHQKLGEDYGGIAGYYTPLKEVRLPYHDREVLYIVGRAVIESSCCGTGNWPYALAPGFILEWHQGQNENGLPVTSVELIQDPETRKDLLSIIRRREELDCITFW